MGCFRNLRYTPYRIVGKSHTFGPFLPWEFWKNMCHIFYNGYRRVGNSPKNVRHDWEIQILKHFLQFPIFLIKFFAMGIPKCFHKTLKFFYRGCTINFLNSPMPSAEDIDWSNKKEHIIRPYFKLYFHAKKLPSFPWF